MSVTHTKPNETDAQVGLLLSQGFTTLEVANKIGVSVHSVDCRLRKLFRISGMNTREALVYWMLDKDYLELPLYKQKKRVSPTPEQLAIVELIARGYSREIIGRKLGLCVKLVSERTAEARRITQAKNNIHLIAICWLEDWIV